MQFFLSSAKCFSLCHKPTPFYKQPAYKKLTSNYQKIYEIFASEKLFYFQARKPFISPESRSLYIFDLFDNMSWLGPQI